ncbi:hypothetical protein DRF69_12725 [Chryseobacterium sp. 5_R23647]|nr:hypothetical protein DRF69_12725 [Chryseobacterium sp. 5_R23647]
MEEENFLVHINNRYNLHFFSLKRKTGEKIVNFYKYLLSFDIPIYILESFQYDKHINESLVTEICKIQGCLPLDKQQKKRLAYLLKL